MFINGTARGAAGRRAKNGQRMASNVAAFQPEPGVCDLAATLGMTQSAISHQLSLMREMRVVKNRKAGRMVYYTLDDEHIRDLFQRGLEHIEHR
ncbi:ArsR/SmtB family transcription factor [Chloroflexota bacterium]